jgi:hypothetical protein
VRPADLVVFRLRGESMERDRVRERVVGDLVPPRRRFSAELGGRNSFEVAPDDEERRANSGLVEQVEEARQSIFVHGRSHAFGGDAVLGGVDPEVVGVDVHVEHGHYYGSA